jgi:hypothetical protein
LTNSTEEKKAALKKGLNLNDLKGKVNLGDLKNRALANIKKDPTLAYQLLGALMDTTQKHLLTQAGYHVGSASII